MFIYLCIYVFIPHMYTYTVFLNLKPFFIAHGGKEQGEENIIVSAPS